MEGLVGIIVAIFVMLFGTGTSPQVPVTPELPGSSQSVARTPIVIDDVQAMIMKSFPAQISLQVDGHLQDGCGFPVLVEQRREGNTVIVEMYREVETDVMCPMIYKEYHGAVHLDGTFESGTYTIRVNDFEMQVTV